MKTNQVCAFLLDSVSGVQLNEVRLLFAFSFDWQSRTNSISPEANATLGCVNRMSGFELNACSYFLGFTET